jgi:hypothetical protein
MISFVELLHVPTTGVTSKNQPEFFALLDPEHIRRLEEFILDGSADLVFVGAGVLRLLRGIAATTGNFQWLVTTTPVKEEDGLVRLFQNQQLRIYQNHSFSSTYIHGQLPALRRRLSEILPGLD